MEGNIQHDAMKSHLSLNISSLAIGITIQIELKTCCCLVCLSAFDQLKQINILSLESLVELMKSEIQPQEVR